MTRYLLLALISLGFLATVSGTMNFTLVPVATSEIVLNSPTCITNHPDGLWVVSDTGNDRVIILNQDLSLNSSYSGGLRHPRGIDIDDQGRIWVADTGNHRVLILDAELDEYGTLGLEGSGEAEFRVPWGIDVKGGLTAVADSMNRRIQILGPCPCFIKEFGQWGTEAGDFDGPMDLSFDSHGRLLVVDAYLEPEGYVRRVQIFNPDFSFNSTIWDIQSRLRFTRPVGIDVSENGMVAVADFGADRIYFFNSNGDHLGGFSGVPGEAGFDDPYDMAFSKDGKLLASVENGGGRVRLWRIEVVELSWFKDLLLPVFFLITGAFKGLLAMDLR